MDVKNMPNAALAKVLDLYSAEMRKTNKTRLDNKGRLYCLDEYRSPHSHAEAHAAVDEMLKRDLRKIEEFKDSIQNYLRARERHDMWMGILCQRVVAQLVHLNGEIPAKYLAAAE